MTAMERPGIGWTLIVALTCACTGIVSNPGQGQDEGLDPLDPDDPFVSGREPGSPGTLPQDPASEDWRPTPACNPILPRRVTRLSDRHLANSLQALLGLPTPPEFHTASGTVHDFLPNKAAALGGAVASKLQNLVESLATNATRPGSPLVACAGDQRACARGFIDQFAGQAFRSPISREMQERLLVVYDAGRGAHGDHAGGIRLLIEAILQAPSFVYQTELGTDVGDGRYALTQHELAAKVSFFLTDTLPDAELRRAADEGRLGDAAGVRAQVMRLLTLPETRRNVENVFHRLFLTERIFDVNKATTVTRFTSALKSAMQEEVNRFIADVLWNQGASLQKLLTSTRSFVNPLLAEHYGVQHPGGTDFAVVDLPEDERAGILTRANLMTVEALPDESSVVHRGVFTVRDMMCLHPPPPDADALNQAEALFESTHTERERAIKRASVARCAGCHAFFDPYGINFEHYDTLGRYRTAIETPHGSVPVDAAWEGALYDVRGPIADAVELSHRLASSGAVRECMARQLGSYALGQRLTDDQACTISALGRNLEKNGDSLLELIADVAAWPGLRYRHAGEAP